MTDIETYEDDEFTLLDYLSVAVETAAYEVLLVARDPRDGLLIDRAIALKSENFGHLVRKRIMDYYASVDFNGRSQLNN